MLTAAMSINKFKTANTFYVQVQNNLNKIQSH